MIKERQIKQLTVIHDDIERLTKQFHITTEARPTKKNKNNKRYVMNDIDIAQSLGFKGRMMRKAKFDDIIKISK